VRIRLVVNPVATAVSEASSPMVAQILSARHDVDVVTTERRDDATALALAAAEDGVDAVAVLGGDGTANEVADALVGTDVALAPLPGGGTNVLCRTWGVAHDLATATEQVSAALAAGSVSRVGVGMAGDRCFTFHAGIGWDAALVEVVERHARWKRRFGHALFAAAGLRTFLGGFDRSEPGLVVRTDRSEATPAYFVLVMNSDPYTFVGPRPFVLDPGHRPDRPLTVLSLASMAIPHFLGVMTQALAGHGVTPTPWLEVHHDVREVEITATAPRSHQLDGDVIGGFDRLEIRYRPAALRLVTPDGTVTPAATLTR
jgi:diacylglycerol kinase family enzyme